MRWIDAGAAKSSDGNRLRIAGVGIMVLAAVAQALLIVFNWSDAVGYQVLFVLFAGWAVAGIALLLGRFLTPYVSGIVPIGTLAGVAWMAAIFIPEPSSGVWRAATLGAFVFLLAGPTIGAWLAGCGLRKRHRSRMQRVDVEVFD
jgi:hypothetical protein